MERLFVTGGARLEGSVRVSGAKNSALKLMAAALLAPGRSVVRNVPRIRDCAVMAELLEHFGVAVDLRDGTAVLDATEVTAFEAPHDLVGQIRATIVVLGLVAPVALYPDPLLAQVLAASTYPLELVQLQQWLAQHQELKPPPT